MSINYAATKTNFTSGGEFTLTGAKFEGYFNIKDGVAFAGRDREDQRLDPSATIRTEMRLSDYFKDRLIIDSFTFPFVKENILVGPNEKVTKRTFNSVMTKMYQNMIFLYSRLFMAGNNIPIGYNSVAAISGDSTDFRWYDESSGTSFRTSPLETIGLAELDGMNHMVAREFDSEDGYVFFGISNSYFLALTADAAFSNIVVALSTNKIAQNTESEYSKLEDMSMIDNDIYITDTGSNTVYKYDISGFFNGDRSIYNKRFLIETIGGSITKRTAYSKNKFSTPSVVGASNTNVYVYDQGSQLIKIYDRNFIWKKSVPFAKVIVKDIEYNKSNKYVYVLIYDPVSTFNHIYVCDAELNILENWTLDESIQDASNSVLVDASGRVFIDKLTEEIRRIEFSSEDSNIFYVLTNRSVFKKFVSRPDKTIGKWISSNYGIQFDYIWNLQDITWEGANTVWNELSGRSVSNSYIDSMSIVPHRSDLDSIFMLTKSGPVSAFNLQNFNESTQYDSVLAVDNFTIYTDDELEVSGEEYVQGLVYNKQIYMLATNLLTIKNLIRGRFKGEYTAATPNLQYAGYVYLTDSEIENIAIDSIDNLYIYENEVVSPVSFNRVLDKLYDFQAQLLSITQTKVIGSTSTTEVTGGNIAVLD